VGARAVGPRCLEGAKDDIHSAPPKDEEGEHDVAAQVEIESKV
jgi:hypothetical protein